MAGHTETHRTDEGYVLERSIVVGTVVVTRRDDLRGCWEVEGTVYGSKAEAVYAAERALDGLEQGYEWTAPTGGETTAPDPTG